MGPVTQKKSSGDWFLIVWSSEELVHWHDDTSSGNIVYYCFLGGEPVWCIQILWNAYIF